MHGQSYKEGTERQDARGGGLPVDGRSAEGHTCESTLVASTPQGPGCTSLRGWGLSRRTISSSAHRSLQQAGEAFTEAKQFSEAPPFQPSYLQNAVRELRQVELDMFRLVQWDQSLAQELDMLG